MAVVELVELRLGLGHLRLAGPRGWWSPGGWSRSPAGRPRPPGRRRRTRSPPGAPRSTSPGRRAPSPPVPVVAAVAVVRVGAAHREPQLARLGPRLVAAGGSTSASTSAMTASGSSPAAMRSAASWISSCRCCSRSVASSRAGCRSSGGLSSRILLDLLLLDGQPGPQERPAISARALRLLQRVEARVGVGADRVGLRAELARRSARRSRRRPRRSRRSARRRRRRRGR